ncbi:hypothetical protein VTO73DRAFT_12097 [Trametes versicolor]
MEMMILDLGTTVAILAAALAIIPLPDVFIGWFCMLFPAMRSPATRMGDLHASLDSTRNLITRNWPNRNTEGTPNADSFRQWHIEWDTIEREANKLEVLVKGGGWGRYSVAHLWCCGPRMRRLDRKLASVTKRLVLMPFSIRRCRRVRLQCRKKTPVPAQLRMKGGTRSPNTPPGTRLEEFYRHCGLIQTRTTFETLGDLPSHP